LITERNRRLLNVQLAGVDCHRLVLIWAWT